MKFEKILVPIDFSDMSRDALAAADRLATEVGGSLTLMHVKPNLEPAPLEYTYADSPRLHAEQLSNLEQHLQGWAKECKTPQQSITVRAISGIPADTLIDATKEHDLVVMRTHGRSGVSRFFLGSVAERVVRGAQCSVFILKQDDAD
jgi:nucleotide-binding universal stress UspA family protein